MSDGALATVLIAMIGGAIRVSTPFMFVALGETITEKSGRINLGLEGMMRAGAFAGHGIRHRLRPRADKTIPHSPFVG